MEMIEIVNFDDNKLINELQVVYNELIEQKKDLKNVNNPFLTIYIYKLDDKIIGFVEVSKIYDRYEIDYVYVLEKYRKNKIGTKLINKVIEDGKKDNIKNITLEVNKNNNPAIELYKKEGFIEIATRKGYYKGIDGILMEKEMI